MMERTGRRGPRVRSGRASPWLLGPTMLALAAVAVAAQPAALAAQERSDSAACRCVDRDGNEIENCTCLRTFSGEPLSWVVSSMTPRRAVVGVYIDVAQADEWDRQGARIDRVRDDGPADEAGLREGDLVVRVGGRSVFDALPDAEAEAALDLDQSVPIQRFRHLIGELEPDEPVDLEVIRDGQTRTFTVTPERAGLAVGLERLTNFTNAVPELRARMRDLQADTAALRRNREALERHLGEVRMRLREGDGRGTYRFEVPSGEARMRFFADSMPQATWEAFGGSLRSDPCLVRGDRGDRGVRVWAFGAGNCIDGVEFVALNPELGSYFGTDEGVLVAEVAEGSELGLRPGDVLLAVDGREVTDPSRARRILASYGADEEMRLRVRRQGSDMEVLGRRR